MGPQIASKSACFCQKIVHAEEGESFFSVVHGESPV